MWYTSAQTENPEELGMGVTLLVSKEHPVNPGDEIWLRRQAIQVAAQLPEKREDALKVLDYARELVIEFLMKARPDRETDPV